MADISKKLKPLGGHLLIKPILDDKMTKSGIIIPDTAEEKPQKGKVMALGTGKRDTEGKIIPFNVKINDSVIFKKYSPEEIEVENEKYFILEEEDILAVVNS
jgi:chaperonin GroES